MLDLRSKQNTMPRLLSLTLLTGSFVWIGVGSCVPAATAQQATQKAPAATVPVKTADEAWGEVILLLKHVGSVDQQQTVELTSVTPPVHLPPSNTSWASHAGHEKIEIPSTIFLEPWSICYTVNPDQTRVQVELYAASHGWKVVGEAVEGTVSDALKQSPIDVLQKLDPVKVLPCSLVRRM